MSGGTVVWFRQDLRLRDNPALHAAVERGEPVIPVFIWSPEEEGEWPPGAASRWWLHQSLLALNAELRKRASRLILARGPAARVLGSIARETGADTVCWNRRYEPAAQACSLNVTGKLQTAGVRALELNGSLLSDPATLLNQSGKPYQVYTPFQHALLRELDVERAMPAPRTLCAPRKWPEAVSLQSLELLPRIKWYSTMERTWRPGEAGAQTRLARLLRNALPGYRKQRDFPGIEGTSRLSPHLHFGEIGPRQIWRALGPQGQRSAFMREIVWREFAYYLLHHFPHTPDQPLRQEFAKFPWREDSDALGAWSLGRTGVVLVDAGMRQLWATGWMHNRVRMVVASFLVKNLLVPWQAGARWFWDTLVDADLANNTLNWQWVAGCGADAAPFFRIFNPIAQRERFDQGGDYVHAWVPELRDGSRDYPAPIVDLKASRKAALEAYESMRSGMKTSSAYHR